jgi:capsular polysaccharide biosynthesis protein
MTRASVFIFDASYPCVDVAVPIDEAKLQVVVADRNVEPPPGHRSLHLEEIRSFATLARNLRSLRAAWLDCAGEQCIVIAAPTVRKEQILRNVLYALSLSTDVNIFDGTTFRPIGRSWRLIMGASLRVLAKSLLRGVKLKVLALKAAIRRARAYRSGGESAAAPTVATLFGVYGSGHSFSLPPDDHVCKTHNTSIYGNYTRGWYLPMLSHRPRCYVVQTRRHRLRDVCLHVAEYGEFSRRFLFRQGRILDYPYLLGKRQRKEHYLVATRREVRSLERGIDMLHYTSGYYHWLVEGIPRVLDLIDDGVDFDEYPLILPPLETFQRELLELLGISPARHVVTLDKGDWCHVRECIMPTANFAFAAPEIDDASGQPEAALLRRIRDRILERLTPGPRHESAFSRLYISRAKAAKRRFTPDTEASVRAILESEGYRTVYLEDLPWAQQVRLVSSAEHIAGLHGAGLANLLFARPKSLLEFQNPLETRSYFAWMARELDVQYAYLIGKLEGYSGRFDNITLDTSDLAQTLLRMHAVVEGEQILERI